jgi:hypothetical protein
MREYLEALQSCPVEQLEDRLGIDDNWHMYVSGDHHEVAGELGSLSGWRGEALSDSEAFLRNEELHVGMRIINRISTPLGLVPDSTIMESNDYNLTVILSLTPGHMDREGQWRETIAKVVQGVGSHLVGKNLSTYFPQAVPQNGQPVVHMPQ